MLMYFAFFEVFMIQSLIYFKFKYIDPISYDIYISTICYL
jgi:hypothetical protein